MWAINGEIGDRGREQSSAEVPPSAVWIKL
jgi:hypothetical protein